LTTDGKKEEKKSTKERRRRQKTKHIKHKDEQKMDEDNTYKTEWTTLKHGKKNILEKNQKKNFDCLKKC